MIRERVGKRGPGCIQVITARYDRIKGRNRQTVIARLPGWADELPEEVAAKLRPVERANAKAFFAARRERRRLEEVRFAVAALVQTGGIVRDALRNPALRDLVLEAAGWYGLGAAVTETCAALAAAGVPLRAKVKATGRARPKPGLPAPAGPASDGRA